MTLIEIKDWFELFSHVASIIGIPVAILVYYRNKKRERNHKEKEALFNSLLLYVDFLKICLKNPELDTYDTVYELEEYSDVEKKELIIFEILIAYLESAFVYYKDQSKEIKAKRWQGWVSYIKGYLKNEKFIYAWQKTGNEWDTEFMIFINSLILDQKGKENIS